MYPRKILLPFILGLASFGSLLAQNEPVIVQAESGTLGAEMTTGSVDGATYIETTTDLINANFPGSAARVASYTVTFPAAGTYDLYIRLRIGPGGGNDDSFFYGNNVGAKSPTNGGQWITVNNITSAGFTAPTDTVFTTGTVGIGVFKWIKLSDTNFGEAPARFTVPADALTQTFQFGGRENGLLVDKFAFGRDGIYYTVANLDSGTSGTNVAPPPPIAPLPPYTPSGPPLATGKSKYLGSVQTQNFLAYFNEFGPENAGKWDSVEATRNVMNWAPLDAAYNLAKSNGLPFKFHVLVWGNQQPAWIETLPPEEQLMEIREWFQAVAARYPDLDYVEVVNEPLHDPPNQAGAGGGNYINALGGSGATGWDWVITSFQMAREIFPAHTKLVLNDYSVENSTTSALQYRTIIELLQERGLIDVIGVQAHAFSTTAPSSTMQASLDILASTGLPIVVTEFDIDGPSDAIQLAAYQRIFPIFWEHPSVIGITLWGHRPGLWRDAQAAYITLANGGERPAMVWLKSYVPAPKRPSLRIWVNDGDTDLNVPLGGTADILSVAGDPDGDMSEHWLEVMNPSGLWSWEGWLTGEPWEGALVGNSGRSTKRGSMTFNHAGTYYVRASAVDSANQWVISRTIKINVGLSTRPIVTLTVGGQTGNLTVAPGTTLSIASHASDADGDMAEHWLEINNPAGQWSWEGWLTGEPWAGQLGGDGNSSDKSGTFTFTQPGNYQIRASADDSTGEWMLSNWIVVTVK